MPLTQVRGITGDEIENIIAGRPYVDLADFFYRANVDTPTLEALLNIGAFDQLCGVGSNNINRRDLYLHLKDLQRNNSSTKHMSKNQLTLAFTSTAIESHDLPDVSLPEQLQNELDILGTEVTSHLLVPYGEFLNAIGVKKSSQIIRERSGSSVLVVGVKVALQTPPIRSGKRVMFLTIDDGFGCNDLTFFEDSQTQHAHVIRNSNLILARGVIRRTGPRGISLRATAAWDLNEAFGNWLQHQLGS